MRQISEQLKSLLKHNNISDLRHKLLLYRRKWVEPAFKNASAVSIGDDLNGIRLIITGLPVTYSAGFPAHLIDFEDGSYVNLFSVGTQLREVSFIDAQDPENNQVVNSNAGGSILFPTRQMLIANINHFPFDNYMLIYRSTIDAKYEIESVPIDITDAINHKGTNVVINQQLDNDAANVWKVGNLALTLYNENNRFWQDKEDGVFPQPYIIYSSKLEYYIGSPTLNDYVKCFTGYLTELPNYRQDEGLVEIRALNRLDWLKTISAENVSTKITEEQLQLVPPPSGQTQDNKKVITANTAVGRIQRVLKGTDLSEDVIELTEKADYMVSQLNDYNNGAIIELKFPLTSNENIWADYIYWEKGITIEDLVKKLLDVANIDEEHRIVESVVFSNNVIIRTPAIQNVIHAWNYEWTNNSISTNNNAYSYNRFYMQVSSGEASQFFNIKTGTTGSIKFLSNVLTLGPVSYSLPQGDVSIVFGDVNNPIHAIKIEWYILASTISVSSIRIFEVINGVSSQIGDGLNNANLECIISFNDNNLKIYINGSIITSKTNFTSSDFNFLYAHSYQGVSFNIDYIMFSPEYMGDYSQKDSVFSTSKIYSSPKIHFQIQNTSSNFLSWVTLRGIISTTGIANPKILVRNKENYSDSYGEQIQIQLGQSLAGLGKYLDFEISNNASKGNTYNITESTISNFIISNIPLGVCNLTNMSVLDALQELASLAMYEIGFDADDKFFFRKRQQTAQYKEITDDEIISMSGVKYDINRLKTRVVVGYGEYTRIVDSDEQGETPPTNKDKYGERTYEISGSQLLPADNVDLAYAIAPTVYEELSKLRLTLSIDIIIDLKLELGDYVRVLHNNNLFSDKGFTDFTKWKETGTYYMKCKVVGIKTDFNKRITTLDLIDYTSPSDIPVEQGKEFAYQPQETFDVQK